MVVEGEDVGMRERRDGTRFTLEARASIGIARDVRRQHLDGHVPSEPRVARAIDFAHAAGAERCEDLVRSEASPGGEGQSGKDYMGERRCDRD